MPALTDKTDCVYCVDWLQPAGCHDQLGPVYGPCRFCVGACPTCRGDGLLPADPSCLHCLAVRLAARGLTAVVCATCSGVIDLLPATYRPAGGTP
jgi:hypothetical protein